MAAARLQRVPVDRSRRRPLVGVAGDVYTRINHVANQDLFRWLEAHGCEVWPASFMVDIIDFAWRRDIGRDLSRGRLTTALLSGALMLRKEYSSRWVRRRLGSVLTRAGEPGFREVLELAAPYVGEDGNEILILNVAKMVDFARRGVDGVVNAMGLNCMLGTVSAAIARRIRDDFGSLPVANLVYGGGETGHRTALEAFVHQVHERRGGHARPLRGPQHTKPDRRPVLWA